MMSTSHNRPRFLPTLTEVVQPLVADKPEPSAEPNQEDVVKLVMQRVDEVMAQRLPDELAAMRQALESVVRQAVSEALSSPQN